MEIKRGKKRLLGLSTLSFYFIFKLKNDYTYIRNSSSYSFINPCMNNLYMIAYVTFARNPYIVHTMNYTKKNRFQSVPIAALCLYI